MLYLLSICTGLQMSMCDFHFLISQKKQKDHLNENSFVHQNLRFCAQKNSHRNGLENNHEFMLIF